MLLIFNGCSGIQVSNQKKMLVNCIKKVTFLETRRLKSTNRLTAVGFVLKVIICTFKNLACS